MSMDTKAVLSQDLPNKSNVQKVNIALTAERIGELYRQSFSAMMGRLREPLKQYVPDTAIEFARAIEQEVIASLRAALAEGEAEQKRDDTGRLTSDYEPTKAEIEAAREAICREFGTTGTDGYYIRIIKAINGASTSPAALRAAVIEECAKEVGAYDDQAWFELTQEDCAAAIRKLKERA